ncbi:hypothetical protein M446_4086 [Methylobacterium sp. 4-46]|nr:MULTISPECIES: hypothetical protein [Methylobacterium]ACA18444.1 hypothetical protein M446_4086 [Methylobacterium sp. 4-46]WFT77735.1 hypothetical protein QA634_20765 [Methylobacterium nodulans]
MRASDLPPILAAHIVVFAALGWFVMAVRPEMVVPVERHGPSVILFRVAP